MRIGVPKEVKNHEGRVALTPESARQLVQAGHEVGLETAAGMGIGCDDDAYRHAGGTILPEAADVFEWAELVVKVKELQPEEYAYLRKEQILFTYLHLAPDRAQTLALQASGAICIAYETVTGPHGDLPLLRPMSQVAGRLSVQAGAQCLEKRNGGRGLLLAGVPGVPSARVVIIGGGEVGLNAALMGVGARARVTLLDTNWARLAALDLQFGSQIETLVSSPQTIEALLPSADVVIGAALLPGAVAPKVLREAWLPSMKPGSVLVDVAIDQGGCFESSRPTTHDAPSYLASGVVHYCVTNMPGAVPRTSSYALTAATVPYILRLANQGWRRALAGDAHFAHGLNVAEGHLTHPSVATAHGEPFVEPAAFFGKGTP